MARGMIDTIAILVTHSILLVAFWLLQTRDDLDDDDAVANATEKKRGFGWRGEG